MRRKDPLLKRSHLGSLRNKPPRLPKTVADLKQSPTLWQGRDPKTFLLDPDSTDALRRVRTDRASSARPSHDISGRKKVYAFHLITESLDVRTAGRSRDRPLYSVHQRSPFLSPSLHFRFPLSVEDQIIRIGIIVLRVGEDGPSFARYSTDYRTNCHGSTQPEPISSAPGLASAESCDSLVTGPPCRRNARGTIHDWIPWTRLRDDHRFGRER